jgi:hypothetical protein
LTEGELFFRSDEASKGSYQSIKKIRGILQPLKRVPSKFKNDEGEPGNDQAEVTLLDAEILEMFEGEAAPELPDGKFTFWLNYAPPKAAKAHENTFYNRGFVMSAESLVAAKLGVVKDYLEWAGKKIAERREIMVKSPAIGTAVPASFNQLVTLEYVTKESKRVVLFKDRKKKDAAGNEPLVYGQGFIFVGSETDAKGIEDHIKSLIVGKTPALSLKAVLMDARAKHQEDYVQAAREGKLHEKLGLKLNADGIIE